MEFVTFQFRIKYETNPGEEIYIYGDSPDFGNWKSPKFKLRWSEGHIWKADYESICEQFCEQLEKSPIATLHTASGLHLQVRTKDSIPYTPIFSSVYGREVSNKNRAFYFQKQFVYDIRKIAGRG